MREIKSRGISKETKNAEDETEESMYCPKCNAPMMISSWDGWVWLCFNCSYQGRVATEQEVQIQESFMIA